MLRIILLVYLAFCSTAFSMDLNTRKLQNQLQTGEITGFDVDRLIANLLRAENYGDALETLDLLFKSQKLEAIDLAAQLMRDQENEQLLSNTLKVLIKHKSRLATDAYRVAVKRRFSEAENKARPEFDLLASLGVLGIAASGLVDAPRGAQPQVPKEFNTTEIARCGGPFFGVRLLGFGVRIIKPLLSSPSVAKLFFELTTNSSPDAGAIQIDDHSFSGAFYNIRFDGKSITINGGTLRDQIRDHALGSEPLPAAYREAIERIYRREETLVIFEGKSISQRRNEIRESERCRAAIADGLSI